MFLKTGQSGRRNLLKLSHVEIAPTKPEPRPAFCLEEIHRADSLGITAPPQPNFELRNVTDLRIAWSRAAKDTSLASATNQTL